MRTDILLSYDQILGNSIKLNGGIMIKRSQDNEVKSVETIDTLIGSGTVLSGDLTFTGGLRIDGHIKGNVIASDTKQGTLVLSESGVIEGDISVPHLVINGSVTGQVESTGRLELQKNAKIEGDIHYRSMEMELGSAVNGALVSKTEKSHVTLVDDSEKKA